MIEIVSGLNEMMFLVQEGVGAAGALDGVGSAVVEGLKSASASGEVIDPIDLISTTIGILIWWGLNQLRSQFLPSMNGGFLGKLTAMLFAERKGGAVVDAPKPK